jgi:hypothetical protein
MHHVHLMAVHFCRIYSSELQPPPPPSMCAFCRQANPSDLYKRFPLCWSLRTLHCFQRTISTLITSRVIDDRKLSQHCVDCLYGAEAARNRIILKDPEPERDAALAPNKMFNMERFSKI